MRLSKQETNSLDDNSLKGQNYLNHFFWMNAVNGSSWDKDCIYHVCTENEFHVPHRHMRIQVSYVS